MLEKIGFLCKRSILLQKSVSISRYLNKGHRKSLSLLSEDEGKGRKRSDGHRVNKLVFCSLS